MGCFYLGTKMSRGWRSTEARRAEIIALVLFCRVETLIAASCSAVYVCMYPRRTQHTKPISINEGCSHQIQCALTAGVAMTRFAKKNLCQSIYEADPCGD